MRRTNPRRMPPANSFLCVGWIFVELHVGDGAEINSISLVDVLLSWKPGLFDATPPVIVSRIQPQLFRRLVKSRSWQTRRRL
jgi:hypothetical protein